VTPNRTLIVVPTFNEVENIGSLLIGLTKRLDDADFLVVDDNSPDGTADVVRRIADHDGRVHLLSRPAKAGLGEAYIAGFDWAFSRGYERIVQMDADFSHDPAYLRPMLEELGKVPVVTGTRYVDGGGTKGWGIFRRFLSQGGNWYARFVLGMPYHDLTGGFTAWRREALEKIHYRTVKSKGYAFQVELKFRAHQKGLEISEIPIVFENRRYGTSKMSGKIIGEAALRVLLLKYASEAR
jgi:dolichol-phosphate mannosyltransferase